MHGKIIFHEPKLINYLGGNHHYSNIYVFPIDFFISIASHFCVNDDERIVMYYVCVRISIRLRWLAMLAERRTR